MAIKAESIIKCVWYFFILSFGVSTFFLLTSEMLWYRALLSILTCYIFYTLIYYTAKYMCMSVYKRTRKVIIRGY